MPVLIEEAAPERRKRAGRGVWLLLVPPMLGLLVLVAAAVQPVQFGRHMLVVGLVHWRGFGWTFRSNQGPRPTSRAVSVRYKNRVYRVYEGQNCALGMGDWICVLSWIRGHRER
jgi:hypothetical protein